MDDALTESKQRFAQEFVNGRKLDIEPLVADQWVVISLLQKSIRRGEVATAQRAAFTLFAQKGSAIWRRFMVIAFEDVGAASPDAVAMTVAASTDSSWRRKNGGDLHIAVHLARVLAEAPKSRSAEHLITSAQHHPSLAKARMLQGATSLTDQLAAVMNQNVSLTERAIAVWCASGIGWVAEKRAKADLPALLDKFRSLGVPDELVTATGIAAQKTREPITLMVPLVWLAANPPRPSHDHQIRGAGCEDRRRRADVCIGQAHPPWPGSDPAFRVGERRGAGDPSAVRPGGSPQRCGVYGRVLCGRRSPGDQTRLEGRG